ncbi:MAG TPA: nucleotide exchange factor GrpE [Bacteroidales bacterium]|jgi:molecular chaperone GrpE|nr:nucleotide exchange factor GrpE [Bacteroidales bacterium]MDD4235210.1 nucleotide exchange factor GrpE [Bacteroidales bacterium]MDY0161514.1 nucleotide exchange factor GrpE [Bacteroidales bacterium]HRW22031.1 nucleotide exchange factor GrpE [Bacteroidales bacterium]
MAKEKDNKNTKGKITLDDIEKIQDDKNKDINTDKQEEVLDDEQVEDKKDSKKKSSKKSKKSKSDELEILKQELGEMKDKYLRLSAEFDNYRKRTLKERIELSKMAGENILSQILPVLDDLDRANEHIKSAKTVDGVREGLELIFNKLKEFMKQQGIKEIDAKGNDFDTDLHEAVTKFPVPEKSLKGKVIDVVQKGYVLNDKVIRYAKVVVGE